MVVLSIRLESRVARDSGLKALPQSGRDGPPTARVGDGDGDGDVHVYVHVHVHVNVNVAKAGRGLYLSRFGAV